MQITEDLIQRITAELMKRLGLAPAASSPVAAAAPERLRLLVLGEENALGAGLRAALAPWADMTFRSLDVYDCGDVAAYPVILLPRLGLTSLAQLALGFEEGCMLEARVALSGLLAGRKVLALEEGLAWRRHQATAPKALLRYYAECEKTAQTFGLRLVRESELVKVIMDLGRPQTPPRPALAGTPSSGPKPAVGFKKRLVTESDVAALLREGIGSLSLPAGAIITPLAQDALLAAKIVVTRG